MEAAPVPLTDGPGVMTQCGMQIRGHIGADEFGGPGPLAPGQQAVAAIIAAKLGTQDVYVLSIQGAQAHTGRGVVGEYILIRINGICPIERAVQALVKQGGNSTQSLLRI